AAWAAGEAGITFKKNDVAALQKHILFFYNNPDARSDYSKKSLLRARDFDPEIVSRKFITALESLTTR
ncbi:MAG: hypothetical protein AAB798_00105, partial [Patescibacteria group bacterium]